MWYGLYHYEFLSGNKEIDIIEIYFFVEKNNIKPIKTKILKMIQLYEYI